jgi:hypothetical protein
MIENWCAQALAILSLATVDDVSWFDLVVVLCCGDVIEL